MSSVTPPEASSPAAAPVGTADGALARVLQTIAAPLAANLAPQAQAAANAALSAAALELARIAELPLAERGAALARAELTQLAAGVDALARELRGYLERSGLFYESHLRAWDGGQRPLAELRLEPQARLENAAPPRHEDPAAPSRPAVPAALEPIVREQLATLETRSAVVPLTLWPGQSATLEIGEDPDPPARDAAGAGPAAGWRARLRLELPRLGALDFTLALQGEHVSVGARARDAASRAELERYAPALRAALARQSLALQQLEVRGDER